MPFIHALTNVAFWYMGNSLLYLNQMQIWTSWKYKNLTLVFISFLAAIILSQLEIFHSFILGLGSFGYLSAFLAGILFVNTFTIAQGALILLILAQKLPALEIGLIAGVGAVVGNIIILRFVENNLTTELESIYNKLDHKHHLVKLLHSKFFHWSLPVIGALIIASPLPDELGVTLLGISQMKTYKFIIVSFVLNSLGIFLVVSASSIIKL